MDHMQRRCGFGRRGVGITRLGRWRGCECRHTFWAGPNTCTTYAVPNLMEWHTHPWHNRVAGSLIRGHISSWHRVGSAYRLNDLHIGRSRILRTSKKKATCTTQNPPVRPCPSLPSSIRYRHKDKKMGKRRPTPIGITSDPASSPATDSAGLRAPSSQTESVLV